ncbi:MAG: hypothetical protein JWP01_2317 [Myxococcales bacterium]|nr:hypothetical protein [Myxococcales bacterium]
MTLPSQRWLKIVFVATALVFISVALYLYGFRFFAWVESDASVPALLAAKSLDEKLPVVASWYYANGDVWFLAPHLLAIFPVAVLGLGPASVIITVLLGFVLELIVFVKIYARICGALWLGIFATMVTLMAWSTAHVAFGYIQLGYAFLTMLCLVSFSEFATLASGAATRRWRWAVAGVFVMLVSVQNPTRGFAYLLAPLLAGCCWPWRGLGARRRIVLAAIGIAGWAVAFVVYAYVFTRFVSFSVPRGHIEFMIADTAGIEANFAMFGRGLTILCGGGEEPGLRAIPGTLVLGGALVLVVRDVLAARELTTIRFLGVIALAQLGLVLLPLLIGNLIVSVGSVRYLIPSLLAVLGLASMLAVRGLADAGPWRRRLSTAWLVLVPVAALLASPSARPPEPVKFTWPDVAELDKVAEELTHRGLTRGFSSVLAANLLTVESGGRALTCPVYFRNVLIPQRWLTDTSCYIAATLPETFYVVAERDEHDAAAIRATLPAPIDRFKVGDTYEVSVFRTVDASSAWLDLPITDGVLARFPLRIPATHLQLGRGKVAVAGDDLVATGEQGTVVYGPHIKLPKGGYELSWIGSGVDGPGQIAFSVRARDGQEVLAHIVLNSKDLPRGRSELVRLPFLLEQTRDNLEFDVESGTGGRVVLHEVIVEQKRTRSRHH